MPKFNKICKVCGAEYVDCQTIKPKKGVDRWQDVACCPEHAALWFEKIFASRGVKTVVNGDAADTSVVPAESKYGAKSGKKREDTDDTNK